MKPQRERRQEGDQCTSSSSSRPSNRARICLDGADGEEVLPSYTAGIDSILAWCYANGIVKDVSHIFGPNAVVFTTPPKGTFYMELENSGRSLEVVINGRDLYVMGWRGPNGSYEIKSDTQTVNYMIGTDVRTVTVSRNYSDLCPLGDVKNTRLGIYEFRRAFDALFNYQGGSPGTIKEALGIIAVHLSEATRLQGAFDTVCASLTYDKVSRLYKWTFDPLWVNRYGHYCKQGMIQIAHRMSGLIPPPIRIRDIEVQSAEDIRGQIRVFHIDAYDQGIFAHDPKVHSKPEVCFEERSGASPFQGAGRNNSKWSTGKEDNKTGKHDTRQMRGRKEVVAPGCPPRRRYKTAPEPLCSSPPPPQPDDWLEFVQGNRRVRDFISSSRGGYSRSSALNQMGAPVSDCMSQFPALRKLRKLNYEMRKQPTSSANTTLSQHGAQPSRTTLAKLKCKTRLWSLRCSSLPTVRLLPTAAIQKRRALEIQRVLTTQRLRTVFVTQEAEHRLMRKAPIQQVGTLLSRLLRLLRRR